MVCGGWRVVFVGKPAKDRAEMGGAGRLAPHIFFGTEASVGAEVT